MITLPNCKINLGLLITSRRPDGYHDIATVMVPAPWRDLLEIVPATDGADTLTVSGRPVNCPPERNLVMRAYCAMREATGGRVPPLQIHLHKVIPDGAGLGGGSADASFALRMLDRMFALGLTDAQLADIAATLGADCPFFIYDRPMLATGTGTTLQPIDLDLTGLTLAIAKPPVSVPTAAAYRGVTPRQPQVSLTELLALPLEQWQGRLVNDFEATVLPAYPAIAHVKEAIAASGAIYTSMSGSGSAVFGLYRDAGPRQLAARLRSDLPDSEIFAARL